VGGILRYAIASISLSIVLYVVFALVFSTDEEKQLMRENRLYREHFQEMQAQQRLIGDVVEGLMTRDDAIYEELFETAAPSPDAATAADLIAASDSLSESFYLSAAASASESLMLMAGNVDDCFAEIFRLLEVRRDSIPPLTLPLKGMSYVQAGASVGMKDNPVYQLPMQHDGIDFIAPQGDPVYVVADGKVTEVEHGRKGLGNMVTVDHGNGYVTRYCLLGDITVDKGRKLRRGQQVGTVGILPSMPLPHLHFEVLFHGEVQDPVNHLFTSLTPEEYARLMYMSVSTEKSLD
jgi:hypothetical protein